MKCINCGNENPENNKFCSSCGTKLDYSNQVYQNNINNNVNTPIESVMQTQTIITSENNNNSLLNNTPVSPNTPVVNSTDNQNTKSKKTLLIILIIIVGILVLALVANFLIQQYKLHQVDKELKNPIDNIGETVDDNDNQNDNTIKYQSGTEVTLIDGSKWYVMSQKDSRITLISPDTYGESTYYSKSKNIYEQSLVKEKVENEFLPAVKSSLSSNGGDVTNLTARIPSVEDIREITGISSEIAIEDIEIGSEYRWLFHPGSYWLSTHWIDEGGYAYAYFVVSWNVFGHIEADDGTWGGTQIYIRPVIETSIDNIKQ